MIPLELGLLTDEEIQELDLFLLHEVGPADCMTLDMLDGYLHAIAVGPKTLRPSQWLPPIWGEDNQVMPPMASIEKLNRVLGLIMRLFNGIITGLEDDPPEIYPLWTAHEYQGREYDDAEGWAYGFAQGVHLCLAEWKSLLDTPQGQAWYRPIGLLGEDDYCPEQDALAQTPDLRGKLALQIPDAVVAMYRHWLPYRRATYEREVAKALQPKVGRNEPCPCGSGKKFKKCCGAAADLH